MEFSQLHFFPLLMTCQSECTFVLEEQRGHIDPVISLRPCYLTLRHRDILQKYLPLQVLSWQQ